MKMIESLNQGGDQHEPGRQDPRHNGTFQTGRSSGCSGRHHSRSFPRARH